MVNDQVYTLINNTAAYSTLLLASLIWKDKKTIRHPYIILSFLVCLFTYLIIENIEHKTLAQILIAGPSMLPFTFWLFARSLFNDKEMSRLRLALFTLLALLSYSGLHIIGELGFSKFTDVLSRILSIFFVFLALVEAQAGKPIDLDTSRLKLRRYFTYFVGTIVLVTLVTEIGFSKADQEQFRVVQRAFILLSNSVFIIANFSIKNKIFSKPKKKINIQNPELIEKIQSAMIDEHLYRKEKFTIGDLSKKLGEQEYKVRKAINQDLGYRNFLDFLNSFRIQEAIKILENPSKSGVTILEIAYQTGFNSIGPFNRAFKSTTGLTPTEYRKKHSA